MSNLHKKDKILVLGHRGMVGSSIFRELKKLNYINIIGASRKEIDLTSQKDTRNFFRKNKFECVFLCAARVGGIKSNNTFPAEFIYNNLIVQCNVVNEAFKSGIEKMLFLGSSCIYPKYAKQPIEEEELYKGYLEPTNEPYATAKIAGIKLCESYNRQYGVDYRSVMPTNLYGGNDTFDLEESHVIPSLIKKIHFSKINKINKITIWGTGKVKRDFLYVDDMAVACIHIMSLKKNKLREETKNMLSHINIGSGTEITIKELAKKISKVVGYNGKILFNENMPDGTPRKLLSVKKITRLGWKKETSLNKGLKKTYKWFLDNQ